MSLKNILESIVTELGYGDLNDDREAFLVSKINKIAETFYNTHEIPGSEQEAVFSIDEDLTNDDPQTSLLALPYFVQNPTGIRFFDLIGGNLTLDTMRPRYHRKAWRTDMLLSFRIIRSDGYFKRDLQDISPLTFTLSHIEAEDVIILVKGKTDDSDNITETVTIPAGSLSAITNNAYETAGFEKLDQNIYNISVTDVNGDEVSVIPNCLKRPFYTIVQIRDNRLVGALDSTNRAFEVSYKARFIPFINYQDEFPAPYCDEIIFWKFAEWYESGQVGHEDRAVLAATKAQELLIKLQSTEEVGKDIKVNFGSNRFVSIQRNNTYYPRWPQTDYYTP